MCSSDLCKLLALQRFGNIVHIKAVFRIEPEVSIYSSVDEKLPEKISVDLSEIDTENYSVQISLANDYAGASTKFAAISEYMEKELVKICLDELPPIDTGLVIAPDQLPNQEDYKKMIGEIWNAKGVNESADARLLRLKKYPQNAVENETLSDAQQRFQFIRNSHAKSITEKIAALAEYKLDAAEAVVEYIDETIHTLEALKDEKFKKIDEIINLHAEKNAAEKKAIETAVDDFMLAKSELQTMQAELAAAIYNAAKAYYIHRWRDGEGSIQQDHIAAREKDRLAFNKIFGEFVLINPDFSFTSLEYAIRNLNAIEDPTKLEAKLSALLANKHTTAFLRKELIKFNLQSEQNPEGKYCQAFTEKSKGFQFNKNVTDNRYNVAKKNVFAIQPETIQHVLDSQNTTSQNIEAAAKTIADEFNAPLETARKNIQNFPLFLIEYEKLLAKHKVIATRIHDTQEKIIALEHHVEDIDNANLYHAAKDALREVFTQKNSYIQKCKANLEDIRSGLKDHEEAFIRVLNHAEDTTSGFSLLEATLGCSSINASMDTLIAEGGPLDSLDANIANARYPQEQELLDYFLHLARTQSLISEKLSTLKKDSVELSIDTFTGEVASLYTEARDLMKHRPKIINRNETLKSEEAVIAAKIKDDANNSTAILKCHMILSILENMNYWKQQTRREETISVVIDNDDKQTATIPQIIYDLMQIVNAREYQDWDTSPDVAHALLSSMKVHIAANSVNNRNQNIQFFLDAIDSEDSTPLALRTKMLDISIDFNMLPDDARMVFPLTFTTVKPRPSFSERYPKLTSALIGMAIAIMIVPIAAVAVVVIAHAAGIVLPTVAFVAIAVGLCAAVGFIAGAIKGKIDEHRERKLQAQPQAEEIRVEHDQRQLDVNHEHRPQVQAPERVEPQPDLTDEGIAAQIRVFDQMIASWDAEPVSKYSVFAHNEHTKNPIAQVDALVDTRSELTTSRGGK